MEKETAGEVGKRLAQENVRLVMEGPGRFQLSREKMRRRENPLNRLNEGEEVLIMPREFDTYLKVVTLASRWPVALKTKQTMDPRDLEK